MSTRQMLTASGSFATFGELLKFLRRRARLTQRELGVAVGYSEAQISRLEQAHRLPDPATIAALFLPALRLQDEPELAARLIELATAAREGARRGRPARSIEAPSQAVPRPRDGGRQRGAAASHPAAIPAAPPHLVDRPEVLKALRDRLDSERLVVLCGLAGTGKTTLAAALARAGAPDRPAGARQVAWLTAGADTAIGADVLALRIACGLAGAPARTEQAVRAHLAEHPALLIVDDAHALRGAPDSLALLADLARIGDTAVLLVSREELPLPGTAVVRLGGLRTGEGRALIAALRGPVPLALADRLLARTGGSPMLLRLALGHLTGDDPDTPLLLDRLEAQPEVASYLVDTTLGRLDPASEQLVAVLSVFRRPVDLHDETLVELCHRVDGPYDLLAAIRELQRRQIIDHPARAVLHPLLRDHGYATLLADVSRRRRLHRVAAEWSERVAGDVLEAAWHYTRAGDAESAAALLAARAAGLVEQGRGPAAAELAARLLTVVLTRADADPAVVHQLRLARGDLLAHTDRAADAETCYRDAYLAAAPPAARAEAAWRLADVLLDRGCGAEALELCLTAGAELSDVDGDGAERPGIPGIPGIPELVAVRARLAAVECRGELFRAAHDAAVGAGQRALALATRLRPAQPRLAAEVAARAYAVIGIVSRLRRDDEAAQAHLGSSIAAARMAGLPRLAARSTFHLGALRMAQGDWDGAEAILIGVLPDMQARGDSYGTSQVLQALGLVRRRRGDAPGAAAFLTQAGAIQRRLGGQPGEDCQF